MIERKGVTIEPGQVDNKTQSFDWGTIQWLHEPKEMCEDRLIIGLTTFYPGKIHHRHVHTGDEQVIYVVSGQGEHYVDGNIQALSAGQLVYIPPFSEHELKNTGDQPLKLIIVYSSTNPQKIVTNSVQAANEVKNVSLEEIIDIRVLQKIQDRFSEALELSLVIVDQMGKPITRASNLPEFCSLVSVRGQKCHRSLTTTSQRAQKSYVSACCSNLVCVMVPIILEHNHAGYVQCGPVFLSETTEDAKNDIFTLAQRINVDPDRLFSSYSKFITVPKSRLYAIAESLLTIANYVVEAGLKDLASKELNAKNERIMEEVQTSAKLEVALWEANMKIIQSQVNPHFLFNTLGTIAELAYMEGSKDAASMAFALSNILRASLRKGQELITLREEITYLQDYLYIQKKRFQDHLNVEITISPKVLDKQVPFMVLQPLVENAIVHGIEPSSRQGRLNVFGEYKAGKIHLKVEDNGIGISKAKLEQIRTRIVFPSDSGHLTGLGIGNLRDRLKYHFGDMHGFNIESIHGKGTTVTLTIPII